MTDLAPAQTHRRDLGFVHPEMEERVDGWLQTRGHSWGQLEAGKLDLPKPPGIERPTPLQCVQVYLWMVDPVLLIETQFRERNGDGPWRLFDYQKPSLRHQGWVINSSAAAVGKTREIVGDITRHMITGRGDVMVVGNEEQTIAEIYDEVRFQRDSNPWLAHFLIEDSFKLRPRRTFRSIHGPRCIMVPTGHDGEPLRGKHISGRVFGDEVDTWTNPEIFAELWRALDPGVQVRLYSVPKGRDDSRFWKLRESAVPLIVPVGDPHSGEWQLLPKDESAEWSLIHWTRPMMPEPFWSAKKRESFGELYDGEDSSRYQRNILGLLGTPESGVFNSTHLERATEPVPGYRCLQLRHREAEGQIETRLDDDIRQHDAESFDATTWILDRLDVGHGGLYAVGVDIGRADDPTEILWVRCIDDRLRVDRRIQLRRFDYPTLAAVLMAMASLEPAFGFGLDAGGAGGAVLEFADLGAECTPWIWQRMVEKTDIHGDPLLDGQDHPVLTDTKSRATELIEQALADGRLQLPPDATLLDELRNHTAKEQPNGRRKFARTKDHTIEALRCAVLRWHQVAKGDRSGLPSLEHVAFHARLGRTQRSILNGARSDLDTAVFAATDRLFSLLTRGRL